jgi:hypothetical protein
MDNLNRHYTKTQEYSICAGQRVNKLSRPWILTIVILTRVFGKGADALHQTSLSFIPSEEWVVLTLQPWRQLVPGLLLLIWDLLLQGSTSGGVRAVH